ncbi:MAG: 2-C-methyl-D-erythritol 4-phosphate cytidylyltransferase [Burkholderiaceae bacterium]
MHGDPGAASELMDGEVEALVQAGGQGTRLGLGPKAFLQLDGCTLLERAVATMRAAAGRVTVAVPAAELERASRLLGSSAQLIAGGARRSETLRRLVEASHRPWLLLHDVVHPFVDAELSQRVLDKARRSGAAAAGLPNTEFLFDARGRVRAAPGKLFAMQKPVAFRRADMLRGLALQAEAELRVRARPHIGAKAKAGTDTGAGPDPSALQILALAGQPVSFVRGHPIHHKLTNADDWAYLQRLAREEARTADRGG